jgi:hypothetical protein
MSKLARRHRRRKFKKNPSPKRNPPITRDLLEWVAPGFGGFAATRLLTRGAQMLIAKKWPTASKHAGAAASIGSFLASWLAGHKVKFVEKYHTPITVGAAIAAAQSLLQIYFPNKLGWIVSDASSQTAPAQVAAPAQPQALPEHLEEINDDPSWYTYNDAYDKGRYGSLGQGGMTPPIQPPRGAAEDVVPIEDPQAGDEELAAGIFGN